MIKNINRSTALVDSPVVKKQLYGTTECSIRGVGTSWHQCHQWSNKKSTLSIYNDDISTQLMSAAKQNVHHQKLCKKFAYNDELVMTAHRWMWRLSHCPDQQRTFLRWTYCRDMSDNKLAGSSCSAVTGCDENQSYECATAFEQDKNWHIKCCQAEHCSWPGNKHIQTGAVKQSTDVTATDDFYLQCGVAGAPEQWKWTFCHRPLYRCQTRVSSVCWVTGIPDLIYSNIYHTDSC